MIDENTECQPRSISNSPDSIHERTQHRWLCPPRVARYTGFQPYSISISRGSIHPKRANSHTSIHKKCNTDGIVSAFLLGTLDFNHDRSPTVSIRSIKKRNIAGFIPLKNAISMAFSPFSYQVHWGVNHIRSPTFLIRSMKKRNNDGIVPIFIGIYIGSKPRSISNSHDSIHEKTQHQWYYPTISLLYTKSQPLKIRQRS